MHVPGWPFEFFVSLPFWGALIIVALLVRVSGSKPRLKAAILCAASSLLLMSLPRFGIRDLVILLASWRELSCKAAKRKGAGGKRGWPWRPWCP